ncbi:hypothetical protein PF006_g5142 [Phytophthora fragariae]|uniref:Uncharacterized protein n=1 Tax=Phytophthora fragariae TaxID=53985 RepID=A0A6A3UI09_9STRA|nr:hypothetical protein PF006_g5142 [Phytophthora fragariae]
MQVGSTGVSSCELHCCLHAQQHHRSILFATSHFACRHVIPVAWSELSPSKAGLAGIRSCRRVGTQVSCAGRARSQRPVCRSDTRASWRDGEAAAEGQ